MKNLSCQHRYSQQNYQVIRVFLLPALIVFFCTTGGPSGHCQSRSTMPEEVQQRLQAAWRKAKDDPTVRSLKEARDKLGDQLENAVSAVMRAADPSLAPISGPAARDYIFRDSLTPEQKEQLKADPMTPNDDTEVLAALEKARADAARLEAQIEEMRGMFAQLQPERDIAKKEQARNAYQSVADKLAKTDPDDPAALAAIYKMKSEAGQHLESETMHELFGPIERILEQNHKRLSDLFAKTGLASPEISSATGLIDWEATSRKAYARLQKSEPRKSSLLSVSLASLTAISLLAAIAIRLFQTRRLTSVEAVETTEKSPSYSTHCPHCDWSHSQLWQPFNSTPINCKCCGKSFEPAWEKT